MVAKRLLSVVSARGTRENDLEDSEFTGERTIYSFTYLELQILVGSLRNR
jgi:hypothetical protein